MKSNMFLKSILVVASMLLIFGVFSTNVNAASLKNARGNLTFLRIHKLGSGYGPPQDIIDGEVIIKLDSTPGMAFGMQLRNDDKLPAHEGMLALLLEAFKNGWKVSIDFWIDTAKKNGEIVRVWVSK